MTEPIIDTSDHWVDIDAGRIFVRAWVPADRARDADATILLFHDSLGSVELWRDFPDRLAAATRRTVLAYDRLGFGGSDPRPGQLPLTFVRDEASVVVRLREALREALGIGALIPFGHSVGGAMAVATAAQLDTCCAALITESAQCFLEDRTLASIRAAREAFAEAGQIERLERYHGAKARWVLHAWTDTWLNADYADWRLDDDLRRVRCPTLALHGDSDEYGSASHAQRIADLVAGPARAVIFERCGHLPHREQPERVLDEVTRFLARFESADD